MEKIVLKFSAQHCFNVLSNLVEVTRCQARCYEKKDTSDRNKLLTFE